jgi:rod shape-determining protein MreC
MVACVAVILMAADHKYRHMDAFRSYTSTLLSPFTYAANIPSELNEWFGELFISRSEIMEVNNQLRDENLILKAKLQRLISLEAENVVLRRMLGSVKKAKGRRSVAEILQVSSDSSKHEITINKGSADDVYKGQPVLDDRGIMGQVTHVSKYFSRVLLITDNLHSIPVKVNRNGARANMRGFGVYNRLLLQHVPQTVDIKVGDTVVSSGLGGVFPAGFPVAVVDLVRNDPGDSYSHIELSPIAKLQQSGLVVLVWLPEFESLSRMEQISAERGQTNGS